MAADVPVAATLTEIRRRWRNCANDDVPRLLKAVEAALKLHRPEIFDGRDADGEEFASYECVTCDNGGLRDNWPCGTYLAITAALTGTQPSKDGSDRD